MLQAFISVANAIINIFSLAIFFVCRIYLLFYFSFNVINCNQVATVAKHANLSSQNNRKENC